MSVSVLLPVYNGGRTLAQTIESVLGQTLGDFEFIIIDDASTDRSAAIIRAYAARDARIRSIFHTENAGLAATLNEGLGVAKNELVARIDQDDEALPERLRVQRDFMLHNPEVVAAGSFVYHMGRTPRHDRLVTFPTDSDEISRKLRDYNCIYHPSTILRRQQILELDGYRQEFRNAEDYDLWLRVARRHRLANIAQPLIRYRFSVDGMTLGRKWEQLYYVYLAQAAATFEDASLDDAERVARRRLDETDRRDFFTHVVRGTVGELFALHMYRAALHVTAKFGSEVGYRRLLSIGARRAWASVKRD